MSLPFALPIETAEYLYLKLIKTRSQIHSKHHVYYELLHSHVIRINKIESRFWHVIAVFFDGGVVVTRCAAPPWQRHRGGGGNSSTATHCRG